MFLGLAKAGSTNCIAPLEQTQTLADEPYLPSCMIGLGSKLEPRAEPNARIEGSQQNVG